MQSLPKTSFNILVALSLKPRHGYEIMSQVEEDTQGKIKMGPGALYTSIKQLNKDGLIRELEDAEGNSRRRYYELTPKGRQQLNAEVEYYESIVKLAKSRGLAGAFQWQTP